MRGRAGSVPEISVFPTEISVSGLEILPYEDVIPVTGPDGIVLHCLLHFTHHSIPFKVFNCSETALRVAEAMIGSKVDLFVFRHVCFVSRIWRQNSSTGSLSFFHPGNRAEISYMNPRRNSSRSTGLM